MSKSAKKTTQNATERKIPRGGSDRGILNRFNSGTNQKWKSKDWEDVKEYFDQQCVYCGKKKKLVHEHAIPVNAKYLGLSRRGNIVPACRKCNSDKGARHYVNFCRRLDNRGKIAKRGRDAEHDIKQYMKEMRYKKLGKNPAERKEIRVIISMARELAATIRDAAAERIKKIVTKNQTNKKAAKRKPATKK